MTDTTLISIIIPAYNEELRIPPYLRRLSSYCASAGAGLRFDIIVVDDGSSGNTAGVAAACRGVRVIRLEKNTGKGYAVSRGLLEAAGEVRLFLDADGSVAPEEIGRNLHYIFEDGYHIFAGSRVLKGRGCRLKAKWYRRVMGWMFNLVLHAALPLKVRDTQCGFKMFRAAAVGPLFGNGCLCGYAFDIEILLKAQYAGYRIKEGPVSWEHIGGSKVDLLVDSLLLLADIFRLRKKYARRQLRAGA